MWPSPGENEAWRQRTFISLAIQPLLVTLLGCSRLTALHMAVQGGSWDSVDCLLKHNASQNVR